MIAYLTSFSAIVSALYLSRGLLENSPGPNATGLPDDGCAMQTGVAQSKMFSQCASRKQEVVVALRMKPAMGRPVVLYTCRPRTALFVTTGRFLQKFSAKRRRRSSSEASVGVVDAQMRPGDPSDSVGFSVWWSSHFQMSDRVDLIQ